MDTFYVTAVVQNFRIIRWILVTIVAAFVLQHSSRVLLNFNVNCNRLFNLYRSSPSHEGT